MSRRNDSQGLNKDSGVKRNASKLFTAATRRDYIDLVDFYGNEPSPTEFHQLAEQPRCATNPPQGFETLPPGTQQLLKWIPRDIGEMRAIERLEGAIRNGNTGHEELFSLYKDLPEPRAPYLRRKNLGKLLSQLSVVERKSEASMLRFLSIIEDMRNASVSIFEGEWNSAIAFAGQFLYNIRDDQVESALHLWKEMESTAGIRGSEVTFNILFDISIKAGRFALADMVREEMEARGLRMDRYSHVSQIYYHGLRGDGDSVRTAYKELVEAGEIVDTTVMNAVIGALLKSGEATAAEQVYERMKKLHAQSTHQKLPPQDWREARFLGRTLSRMTRIARSDRAHHQIIQGSAPIAPDLRTYRTLINYHCLESGEIERVASLLNEMPYYNISLHGIMFLLIFRGFTVHGGIRYTLWTKGALDSVWSALLEAMKSEQSNVHMGRWMIIWALRAFQKVSTKARVSEIWEEAQTLSKADAEDRAYIAQNVNEAIN